MKKITQKMLGLKWFKMVRNCEKRKNHPPLIYPMGYLDIVIVGFCIFKDKKVPQVEFWGATYPLFLVGVLLGGNKVG